MRQRAFANLNVASNVAAKRRFYDKLLFFAALILAGFLNSGPAYSALIVHTFGPVTGDAVGWRFLYFNTDGLGPTSVTIVGNRMYGTTSGGTSSGFGGVFAVNTDGSGFTNLHNFTTNLYPGSFFEYPANQDGAFPTCAPILVNDVLYGTTSSGGTNATGTIFAVNTDGSGFTNLHVFSGVSNIYVGSGINWDGGFPSAELILLGNKLYGTAPQAGPLNSGIIFSINTDGSGFTNIYSFTGGINGSGPGSFLLLSNTIYGVAAGGANGQGLIYSFGINETNYTVLYDLTGGVGGYNPAGLVLVNGKLYGTAVGGPGSSHDYNYGSSGPNGAAIVFSMNLDGSGFQIVTFSVGFEDGNVFSPSGLSVCGSMIFGSYPGCNDIEFYEVSRGFAINTSDSPAMAGGGANIAGQSPNAFSMFFSGESLFWCDGNIYGISFAPSLNIAQSGNNNVLSWPTNVSFFDTSLFNLESSTNLHPANWQPVSGARSIVGGQFTLTNPIAGTQMFYRLRQ